MSALWRWQAKAVKGSAEGILAGRRGAAARSRDAGGGIKLALLVLLLVACLLVGVGLWLRAGLPAGVGRWLNPISYEDEIAAAAARQSLDPHLVLAMVKCESGFRPDARSDAGAVGLMQLLPSTAEWITGRPDWAGAGSPQLTAAQDNLALGCYYLRFLLDRYGGDQISAIAAYHAGQGTVDGWLAESGGRLQMDDISYSETRDYVRRVLRYQELYGKLYPSLGG